MKRQGKQIPRDPKKWDAALGHPIFDAIIRGLPIEYWGRCQSAVQRLRWYDCNLKLTSVEIAIVLRTRHPDWTDQQIAVEVRVARASLFRNQFYKGVRQVFELGERRKLAEVRLLQDAPVAGTFRRRKNADRRED